ncbi:MAG: alpha/beta hydrolase [Acidimicrobiia bacterium]|nr:alpha/beta hydrolase [Acidimicrobiia bacterium]
MTLLTMDGVELESHLDLPTGADRVVVFCHPHPRLGGTMNAPLMRQVADGLVARDLAVLRFNFRGVGKSTGTHGTGEAELADIDAAYAEALTLGLDVAMAGWSFGAATSLLWLARRQLALPWVGIAPPVRSTRAPALPSPDELPDAARRFIIGDRDQFAAVEDVEDYARECGGTTNVLAGSDHFFYFREERVAELVAAGVRD